MRLPLLELQLRAGAQYRRQENGSGETLYSEEGGSGNQSNAGLTIVLPLVACFSVFVLLFCFFNITDETLEREFRNELSVDPANATSACQQVISR
jgi:hypothetical protein